MVCVLALAASGCEQTECQRAATAWSWMEHKAKPCGRPDAGEPGAFIELSVGDLDVPRCDQALLACTAEDRDLLRAAVNCMEELPVCKRNPDGSIDWGLDFSLCSVRRSDLSEGCKGPYPATVFAAGP
jgi:hypothetical protein